jgi:hypothetical protein
MSHPIGFPFQIVFLAYGMLTTPQLYLEIRIRLIAREMETSAYRKLLPRTTVVVALAGHKDPCKTRLQLQSHLSGKSIWSVAGVSRELRISWP